MQIAWLGGAAGLLGRLGRAGFVMQHIELCGGGIRACSACSGDYEDPERNASSECAADEAEEDAEERTGDVLRPADREEFPVREE